MHDYVILTDTRQQKEEHIIKEFDKQNILHFRTTLSTGDYMILRYSEDIGMYLDYSTIIDTKKDILEIAGNLCHSSEHQRILREIQRAKDLGCKNFIFLINSGKVQTMEDLENWSSTKTKVKGSTLIKIFRTMSQKYGVKFILVPKKCMGKKIIELLEVFE